MREHWNGPVRWLLALLALQVVLALVAIGVSRSEAASLPPPPDVDAIELPTPAMALTVLSGVARADPIALDWSPDARLSFAALQVDWPTSPPPDVVSSVSPFGWLRLVYVAPVGGSPERYAALSLLFERVSGALIEARVSPWHVGMPRRELLVDVSTTDDTAVLAAELSGGTAYRAACPDRRNHTGVSISIDAISGDPVWDVVYRERNASAAATMRVVVNARDGGVSVVRSGTDSCAG